MIAATVTTSPIPIHRQSALVTPTTDAPTTDAPALHVHRLGAGEPLVLLHGLGESHIGWRPVIDALAAAYDVIAIDLPGFGRSPALPLCVSPTAVNLADAVEQTLDRLGIDRYSVAGYSLGARVAIQLAESDRVTSLIAIAPDGLGTPLERIQGFIAMLAGRGMAMALAPLAEPLSWFPAGRAMFFAGTRSLPWQLAPADARQLLTDFADSPAYDATNWAALFDMPTHLHTISVPALFLQGTADPLMTQQIARYVGLISGARLIYLAGLNHVPISDDPKAVAQHMLSFLGQQAPGPIEHRMTSRVSALDEPVSAPSGGAAYRAHAGRYDHRTQTFQHWREMLVRQLAVLAGDTVLDVGCGTGLCLPGLQEKVGPQGAIVGIDASQDMLDIAAKRVAENGWSNVRLVVAPVQDAKIEQALPDGHADAALFCAVHDVMQSPDALANVFDHLRPGAAVAAIGGKWPGPWFWPLRGWVTNLHEPFIADFTGFEMPWRHLARHVPDLRIHQLGLGTGYLAFGHTA